MLVANAAAFAFRYGEEIPIAGQYANNLSNGGEPLRIDDFDGSTIQDFRYDDTGAGWHPSTDGEGYSLVIVDPTGPLASWSDGPGWRASAAVGGSPGSADGIDVAGDVNGDLRVDLVDLAILQSHFGVVSGGLGSQGDLNGDGAITRADAAILAKNYGRNAGSGSPAALPVASAAGAIVADAENSTLRDPTNLFARRRAVVRSIDHAIEAFDVSSSATPSEPRLSARRIARR